VLDWVGSSIYATAAILGTLTFFITLFYYPCRQEDGD
jgi:hypothetical protein